MSTTDSTPGPGHLSYSFGEFTLDLDRGFLLRAGRDIKLRPKSFEVLVYLAERPGVLVSKEELLEALWGQTVVTEDSVTHCLIDIRKAIGDQSHRMIRTVPKRGYIFDIPVTEEADHEALSHSPFHKKPVSGWMGWPSLAAAILALVGIAALWTINNREIAETGYADGLNKAAPHSIAVLPFLDMSPEQDQAYLADGISEEILNLLAKIPRLKVISRSSAFSFKGKNVDIPTVAQQLNVAHVLEGSVRRNGTQVRISAQLIDARTDIHLWSGTYDRELQDVFQIQDEIAASVVDALRINLLGPIPAMGDVDPNARILGLQARYFYNRKAPDHDHKAMEYFQRALEIDPSYAMAWAGLAGVYMSLVWKEEIPRESGLAKAREAVEKALSLDPDLSDAHARMGLLHVMIDHDWEASFEERRKALALDPNNPLALGVMASVWLDGHLDEAIELYERAVSIDPLTTTWHANLSGLLIKAGRLDEAEETARKALDLSRGAIPCTLNLAIVLLLRGQPDEALELIRPLPESTENTLLLSLIYYEMKRQDAADATLNRLIRTAEKEYPLLIAEAYAVRGEIDEAFAWLDKINDVHQSMYGTNVHFGQVKFDPFLRNLHSDHRWNTLLDSLFKISD